MLRTLILLAMIATPQVKTTINFGSLAAGKCQSATVNHPGVRRGGEYYCSVDGDDTGAGYYTYARDGYVRVDRCAPDEAGVGPSTTTITVSVPQ